MAKQTGRKSAARQCQQVSNYSGIIEVKAGWRVLNPSEAASGRFHTAIARSYETSPSTGNTCFVDATWGLAALHIIQKTPSAPYFIYATRAGGQHTDC